MSRNVVQLRDDIRHELQDGSRRSALGARHGRGGGIRALLLLHRAQPRLHFRPGHEVSPDALRFLVLCSAEHRAPSAETSGFRERLPGRLRTEPVRRERQLIRLVHREPQHPARIADRRAPAVADLLADHRRVLAAVALVHVLQHALAVAVREVDVDVRRALALLAQEALEEQAEADRVHGGDAETETDGGVRRRAASLAEHAGAAREAHDVPDDQEIAREAELADDRELVRQLLDRAPRCASAPIVRARPVPRGARDTRRRSRPAGGGTSAAWA